MSEFEPGYNCKNKNKAKSLGLKPEVAGWKA